MAIDQVGSPLETDRTVLEIRDAEVVFEMDRGQSKVLDSVTLDVKRDEILGVVGESGSGKSMFASALLDAVVDPGVLRGDITYHPEDGDPVSILDLSASDLRRFRWEDISMVFQGALASFNPVMTIETHFRETLKAHNYDMEEGMDHARQLLSDLYLEPERVLNSYPHQLSGGMKQRALIALSLVLKPEVLIMDEPTAALDLLMQRSILALLDEVQEKYDLTIIFITHDLPLVAGMADRLAVMYAFEFCEIGPTAEILENPAHPYTRSLLRAVPTLDLPLSEMNPIEGSSPDPVNVPSGCSYHPRCPLADEQCQAENPAFHDVGADHVAACFHWDQSEEAIPLALDSHPAESSVEYEGKQSDEPVVSLEDVEVFFEENQSFLNLFGDVSTVQAVDDVDLDIYDNDVVALVGESGCGKTTLGKTAVGLQRPTAGSVKYREQDIWEAKDSLSESEIPYQEIRQALQIIHQDPGSSLNPNQRVSTILAKPLQKWYDLTRDERHDRIHGMLDYVGMSPAQDYANRYPHQLSGGEKQRVALIRALLMNPDVILADEAVSALDVSLRVEMMDLMLELQDTFDTSYLFISHNLSNARYFAGKADGRIGVMYLGEVVEIGPVEDVIEDPRHPYTKVLKWSTAEPESDPEMEDPPIRGIDIPDSTNPPSGCRFHTRCPEAREACREETPTLSGGSEGEGPHETACFREYGEDHPYWESDPIVEESVEISND